MPESSSPVTSRQAAPHPRLRETVLKHLHTPWKKPVASHSHRAFEELSKLVEPWPGPLILDTGCGTGMSTEVLASTFPDSLVLGVDKSLARLERHVGAPARNVVFARMDLEDFWLLAAAAGWQFQRQCFYYPNPWPKPEQRLRRWPFHPVWPVALACGGVWELRTNWLIYAQEFALAWEVATGDPRPVTPWEPAVPETLFERKYQASGHPLWRWQSSGLPGPHPGEGTEDA